MQSTVRIPHEVLTRRFQYGFSYGLMEKDVRQATRLLDLLSNNSSSSKNNDDDAGNQNEEEQTVYGSFSPNWTKHPSRSKWRLEQRKKERAQSMIY